MEIIEIEYRKPRTRNRLCPLDRLGGWSEMHLDRLMNSEEADRIRAPLKVQWNLSDAAIEYAIKKGCEQALQTHSHIGAARRHLVRTIIMGDYIAWSKQYGTT